MPPSPDSFGRVRGRKRDIRDMTGPQNTMILDITSKDSSPDDDDRPSLTAQLAYPSVSGEELSSSHSKDSNETDSDTVSESHTVFSFGSGCEQINWKRRRKKRLVQQEYKSQELRPISVLPEYTESDTWNNSSWSLPPSKRYILKQKANEAEISSRKLSSSMHANTRIECNRSKHRKVQGLSFATAESFEIRRKRYIPPPERNRIEGLDHVQMRKKQKSLLRIPFVPNFDTGRFRNQRKSLSVGARQSSLVDSPSVLYRWLRVKLEAGLIQSPFDCLHQLLKKHYDDVVQVFEYLQKGGKHPVDNSSLANLKEKIVGIWCVYAHFTLEAGCLLLDRMKERDCCSRKRMSNVESDLSYDDFFNLAISILLDARDCPLVGNHAAIAICLGRLIVLSNVVKNSTSGAFRRVEVSRKTMIENIQSAIDVCWDGIDFCRRRENKTRRYTVKPISKAVIQSLSNFGLECDELDSEHHNRADIERGIISTLLLPMNLRKSFPSCLFLSKEMSLGDRYTINCLCKELNRWSRLGEKLEMNSQYTVRLRASIDSEVSFVADELPLYSSIEYLSDPLNCYKSCSIPGKEIIWNW